MELDIYSAEGKKSKQLEIPESLLAGPVRRGLLYYAVNCQQANRRAGTHSTKTRGQVRGSTRKLYRQKGTGNARHGDKKAPIYVGGGKAFGPHPRDYSYNLPKTARRRSLQSAMILKSREGNLLAIETPDWKEAKTKQAVELFKALKTDSALLVIEDRHEVIEKSVRNLHKFKVLPAMGLNVYDILNHDKLIVTPGALEKITERLKSILN